MATLTHPANHDLARAAPTLHFNQNKVQVDAGSTGWIVANNDTKTADSDIDDPQEAADLGTKAFVLDTTGKSFIDLVHFYVGTDPADDVKVAAFGFWPIEEGKGCFQPNQVSASYPKASITAVGGGFWAPLFAPIPSGTHVQTLHTGAAAPEVNNNGSTPNYKVKGEVSYGTKGCTRAIVLVTDPAAAPTVGLVLARLGV